VSPAYFRGEYCRKEWSTFRQQEQKSAQDLRVFYAYLETDDAFEEVDPARESASPEATTSPSPVWGWPGPRPTANC
jgi:hypothetical protein